MVKKFWCSAAVVRTRRFAAIVMLITINFSVYAKTVTTVKITALAGAAKLNDDIGISAFVQSSLIVKSSGNKNVRGYFELSSLVTDTVSFDIPRAYIKVRLPWFRVTAGKNRVSWGEGFLFNAGDVIFEGAGLMQNLSYDELRTETAWLADIYIPLGLFSYAETVALPFPAASGASGTPIVSWDLGRYGGRIVAGFAGIKLEAGGIYSKAETKPYISLEGHLFADLYADCSIDLPESVWNSADSGGGLDNLTAAAKDSLTVTAGFFRQYNVEPYGLLTVRSEAKILPYGEWEGEKNSLSGFDPGYGIFIYPEVIYSPDSTLSFSIRSLVSPVDLSGMIFLSSRWNIYQGLNILTQGAVQFGEASDIWGWDRNGSLSCALGFEYRY